MSIQQNQLMSELLHRKSSRGVGKGVTGIMDCLGIGYCRVKRKTFWAANEDNLSAIYTEFCKLARNRLRDLHPDKGGDGHAFGEFRQASNRVRKAFESRGFGRDLSLERALAAQSRFEAMQAARRRAPYFKEYDEDSEIDLSLWKIGAYDRIVQFSDEVEPAVIGEARYRIPFRLHPPYRVAITFSGAN